MVVSTIQCLCNHKHQRACSVRGEVEGDGHQPCEDVHHHQQPALLHLEHQYQQEDTSQLLSYIFQDEHQHKDYQEICGSFDHINRKYVKICKFR